MGCESGSLGSKGKTCRALSRRKPSSSDVHGAAADRFFEAAGLGDSGPGLVLLGFKMF